MPLVLDLFYLLGFVLGLPWLAWRLFSGRGWPWGAFSVRADLPAGAIWLHGSSVGELAVIRPLIALLEQHRPDLSLVISSHTATGVESARRAYPNHAVFRFPMDFSFLQRRLMRRLVPRLIIVVESDLWPNHLLAARAAGVPIVLVNARLSERSCRLHRLTRVVPRAMAGVSMIAAQTEAHARRFAGLGVAAARITVTGNMKYDLTAVDDAPVQRVDLRRRLGCRDDQVVIIGGSLHPQEDLDLLAAYARTRAAGSPTRLVIVPRYPAEARAVAGNVAAAGFAARLKSELDKDPANPGASDCVVVVDTLGELRQLYAAADIAFVGGSLYYRGANKGGHNLMEPAILGLPVIFGSHNFSFRETVADLLAADAGIQVADRDALTRAVTDLTGSAARRAEIGSRARQVVLERQGASARNLELILPMLDAAGGCRGNPEDAQCRHQTRKQRLNE